jgi:hypothetical protein
MRGLVSSEGPLSSGGAAAWAPPLDLAVGDEEDDAGAFDRLMQELGREAAQRRKDREWQAIREDWRAWREELREWLHALSLVWGGWWEDDQP